ncbi:hypothetical protein HJB56_05010 [Rhizobium lentis]|uniref:hypothetical protein n=1 Tax=Rhizobium lentis TaxID=1138194 RepID=UPI001C82BFB8|nr:hypothetical protein [Rhizobium lentis]MBX5082146.1 hypothetical protein [Rhizobium lentis]MBX5094856.1 hypothetical protein [Rhizobium lentis]MBX5119581.1 hypothetical protein [Rhizobium lentis]
MLGLREDIDECTDDAARARWLLTASIDCLVREQSFIRLVLRQSGFLAGLEYLDAELANFRAPRTDDGETVDLITIKTARGRMDRIACGLKPRGMGA